MRQKMLARTLVSLTAVVGIAAGSLAGASASFAAPAQSTTAAEASVLATNNLGLSAAQAKRVQDALRRWGYTGEADGVLGTQSWIAMQHFLKKHHGYTGAYDGDPGPKTIMALQRYLKKRYQYKDAIDGDAGKNTQAAFSRMANTCPGGCLVP
ncbi:peptidoglycan-binding protein [Streptomyces sp. NBC_01012]|uniref:peptidoglycan-binding protein n=1 Tax=Streptomyces sp. NBC_01012 TaxID=2903717 RepID=UPI003870D616|nr:peptidoglycan-binding protein [Streptomyces sp. NBC_01012]